MPYGYEEPIVLTPGQILQKVSQEKIFELILNQPFSYNRRYTSPLRQDTTAGCRFEQRQDGIILWVDFADIPTHRTCFKMLMDTTRLSMEGAIRLLCHHFNLSTNSEDYIHHIEYIPPISSFEARTTRADITYNKREFSKKDILYWSKFIIKLEDLVADEVYAVSRVYINNPAKKNTSFTPAGLCYAIDFIDAVKIYQPLSTTYRWITNCSANHIGNFDNLPLTGNTLIITKSYKDHRVFRNIGLDEAYSVVWFQNEGTMPSDELLKSLLMRFSYIIVFYDNDEQGIKAGMILVDRLRGLRRQGDDSICMTYIPKGYGYKDIAEFISKEGQRDTLNFLTNLI